MARWNARGARERIAQAAASLDADRKVTKVTAENLTDEQCKKLRWSLPKGHWAVQLTVDAVSELDRIHHPNRWRNARVSVAELINLNARREGSK